MGFDDVAGTTPNIVNTSVKRTRRYLTEKEVEKLIEAAHKNGRYGHRDATMILLAYRHGLRDSELVDLQWHQIELNTGRLHVRRSKRGMPSVHPLQGDEIRALRRLRREQEASPHVFQSERGGPMAAKSFGQLINCHFEPRSSSGKSRIVRWRAAHGGRPVLNKLAGAPAIKQGQHVVGLRVGRISRFYRAIELANPRQCFVRCCQRVCFYLPSDDVTCLADHAQTSRPF